MVQIRVHSIVYTADNVLTPEVIRTIYKQRKLLDNIIAGGQNKTFKVREILKEKKKKYLPSNLPIPRISA